MTERAEQLKTLEAMIDDYLSKYPTNSGAYGDRWIVDPVTISKHLRDGIIFYSTGWGWRLRKDWQTELRNKAKV